MKIKKLIFVLAIFVLLIALWVFNRKGSNVATYEDYQKCVAAGGSTIEPNPPTCFHPNGTNITPGRKTIKR